MPFIEMEGREFYSQVIDYFPSPDPEYYFLQQTFFSLLCVEAMRDGPVFRKVCRNISIKQVERYLAHINSPHRDRNRGFNEGDPYHHLVSGIIQDPQNRGCIAIQHFSDVFLPAIGTNMLVEVSFRVHESHCYQGNTQIAAFL